MSKRTATTPAGSYLYNKELYDSRIQEKNGCLEWSGPFNNAGYGMTGFRNADTDIKGMMTVHRLAWMIAHGDVPENECVQHICHNRRCVNPDHLKLGNHADKLKEMYRDGRMPATRAPGAGRPKKNRDI